jgi:hypothetical protein
VEIATFFVVATRQDGSHMEHPLAPKQKSRA